MSEITVYYNGPIVSRKFAKANGLDKYFTGLVCKNGHIDQRNVCDCVCKQCRLQIGQRYFKNNRELVNKKAIERHYRKRDQRLSYKKSYREENKEAIKAKKSQWDKDNVEKRRKYFDDNKDRIKNRTRIWQKNNPDKVKAILHKRRAKISNSGGTFSDKDINKLFFLQKGNCTSCLKSLKNKYHIDHIMPIALGGTNWPKNLQLLCPKCNQRKNAKDPIKWAQENGRLL